MTVCNGEAYLCEAIESVQMQKTSAEWELIVVDDGSSDRSRHIAQSFAAADRRITVLMHADNSNLGISASRNLAMKHARSHVLAFLDADDIWLPYRLEHQLSLLRTRPEIAMIYGQAERWWDFERKFDETVLQNGRNYTPKVVPHGEPAGTIPVMTLLRWFLRDESFTPCTCSVLVRTDVARELGGFDTSFRGLYDDQVFYAKVSLQHPIFVDTRCVARYRRHPDSCCSQASEDTKAHTAFVAWLTKYMACSRSQSWTIEGYLEVRQLAGAI